MIFKSLVSMALIAISLSLSAQITLLKDVEGIPGGGSRPGYWVALSEDRFVFDATNLLENQYLFASDGTEAGTIGLGFFQRETDIIHFGGKAYFGGCNPTFGADSCGSLYVTDGTVAGTQFFFDLDTVELSLGIEDIVAGDSLFFFSGYTLDEGHELWRSNGTVAGTYRLTDLAPGSEDGYQGELAVIDDIAYFAGFTPAHGVEAWRSDGTVAGTFMIEDLNEGMASGLPSGFTASVGYVYYGALGTNSGFEVRRTDSTGRPSDLIGNFGTTASSKPRDFVDSDGTLYYVSDGAGTAGFELFVYNHVGNPVALDFPDGDIFPRALMPFGDGKVVFNAEKDFGREMWISDGTLAGTQMIIDLYPGPKDGVFGTGAPGESFYVWNDSLVYFAGADSVHALDEFVFELFVTNGTAAGTQLVGDLVPGAGGANPGNFFEFGGRLYFAATHPTVEREPFYLGLPTITSVAPTPAALIRSPFPNPLPKGTTLRAPIELKRGMSLQAELYDLQGRLVQKIDGLGSFSAGAHTLEMKLPDHLKGVHCLRILGEEGALVNARLLIE
ncbi:MAG: hypothetical protein AAF804_14380 [Bacteroidota bacterium]